MSLMLTAGQVLKGSRDTHHSPGAVLVDDTGTIAAVGETDTVAARTSPDTRHLDYGEDSTLLPGLVNAHVHLAFDASADPVAGA